MKFRPQRGSLHDAMKEAVEVPDRPALIAHLQAIHAETARYEGGPVIRDDTVRVEKYGREIDARIGWDTHIVMIDGWGPAGFTDGPC